MFSHAVTLRIVDEHEEHEERWQKDQRNQDGGCASLQEDPHQHHEERRVGEQEEDGGESSALQATLDPSPGHESPRDACDQRHEDGDEDERNVYSASPTIG